MPDFELKDLEKNEKKVKAENQELKKELELERNLFVKHLQTQGRIGVWSEMPVTISDKEKW